MLQNFDDIYMELHFDSIYSGSLGKIYLYSSSPFFLRLCDTISIVAVVAGKYCKDKIFSQESEDKHIIKINVLGCMNERLLNVAQGSSSVESYGMQYYPFVSSKIEFELSILGGYIKAISIILPDQYRIIWFGENVVINNNKLKMFHSQGQNESTYIFKKQAHIDLPIKYLSVSNKVTPKQNISFDIPVKFGAKEFLKLIFIPTIYSFLSGLGIILVSDNIQAVLAAIVGVGAFLVKLFNNANPPQANVILKDIYVWHVINVIILVLLIIFIPQDLVNNIINWLNSSDYLENIYTYMRIFNETSNKTQKYIFLFFVFIFFSTLILGYIIYVYRIFNRTGHLPRCLEKHIYFRRKKNEHKNRKSVLDN